MDKREAIQYLRERLGVIPALAKLPYDNQDYPLWRNEILDVLEVVFTRDSTEYRRFSSACPIRTLHFNPQKEYIEDLRAYETAILSIIQKSQVLGDETELSVVSEPKDIAELPIYIFDKMQFHPRVVEASRGLFKDKHYKDAIYRAFVELNNFVKDKSNSQLDGKRLMSTVFSLDNPIIKINPLKTQSDKDEQEGFMLLFMGAMEGIRNPKAHENIVQNDSHRTLEYLGLASLLTKIAEEGKLVKLKPPRERWNLEKFLIDAGKRCMPEKVEIMKKLIDFTVSNSDAGILWGTGAKYGSFVFQKLVNNKATSIFQIYTDGTLFLYFQPLKNKGVSIALLNQFRLNVNKIPGVNIIENVVNEKDKYGSLSLNILINPSNLNIFKEAVLSLCKDLENFMKTNT